MEPDKSHSARDSANHSGRRPAQNGVEHKKPHPNPSIGEYLISQLEAYGVKHVFGIPGDYVLTFYDMLSRSPLNVVGTIREDGAGFAADAYARLNGMGALCVTYCVGGLNVTNPIAQAYAEKSPVVLITGAPGVNERLKDPMLHHKIRTFDTQREIFEKITCASTVLNDPSRAYAEIDRVLEACWAQKRPVYIELPRDMVEARPDRPAPVRRHKHPTLVCDPATLAEALCEARKMISAAKSPVVLADVEVHRFGLQRELLRFIEATNIPCAATIMGKSVISELHPLYLGLFEGALGREDVARAVESSDCLIMLGTILTDLNLGLFTAHLDRDRSIEATSDKVQIQHHAYAGLNLRDFLVGLNTLDLKPRMSPHLVRPPVPAYVPQRATPITVPRLFERLNELLTDDMTIVSDVGDCLFGATDLVIHRLTEFLAPAYYTSMGFGVPAAVGVSCANPKRRAVVLVGDGAFQMTGMELSTIVRQKLRPIIVVLNNKGYTTERFIKDGPYNDILDWNYHELPAVLGAGQGFLVTTEDEFEEAWKIAWRAKEFCLLNVVLDKMDHSVGLERVGRGLCANLKGHKSNHPH